MYVGPFIHDVMIASNQYHESSAQFIEAKLIDIAN